MKSFSIYENWTRISLLIIKSWDTSNGKIGHFLASLFADSIPWFHFSFNQNKLWTNWRILDHMSDAYVQYVGLFGHLFWNKRSFWQQCQIISCHIRKLSANDRRQTETLRRPEIITWLLNFHVWWPMGDFN